MLVSFTEFLSEIFTKRYINIRISYITFSNVEIKASKALLILLEYKGTFSHCIYTMVRMRYKWFIELHN